MELLMPAVVAIVVAMAAGLMIVRRAAEPPPTQQIRNAVHGVGLELVGEPLRVGWFEEIAGAQRNGGLRTTRVQPTSPLAAGARGEDDGPRIVVRVYVASLRDRNGGMSRVRVAVRWFAGEVDQVAFDRPVDRVGA